MIEQVFAKRYMNKTEPRWDMLIQLTRTDMVWNRKEGMQMSGTWEGKYPESGIYLFYGGTQARFYGQTIGAMDGGEWPMIVTFQSDGTWDAIDLLVNYPHPGMSGKNGGGGAYQTMKLYDSIYQAFNNQVVGWLNVRYTDTIQNSTYQTIPEALFGVDKTLAIEDNKYLYVTCYGGFWYCGRDVLTNGKIPIGKATNKVRILDMQSVKGKGITFAGALKQKTLALGQVTKSDGKLYWYALAKTMEGIKVNSTQAVSGGQQTIFSLLGDRDGLRNKLDIEGEFLDGWDGTGTPVVSVLQEMPLIQIDQALDPREGYAVFDRITIPMDGPVFHVLEVDFYNQKTTLECLEVFI